MFCLQNNTEKMEDGNVLVWLSLKTTHKDWKPFFEISYIQDMLRNIEKHIKRDDMCPHAKDIFRVFSLISPNDIKVVILGMDPYQSRVNGKNRANGLAFSSDLDDIPRSLRNIYKEMMRCGYTPPKDAKLDYLVKRGVFLVNSALTVKYNESGSHSKLWIGFTIELLKWIASNSRKNNKECCFVFWGRNAQGVGADSKLTEIDENVFIAPHPVSRSKNSSFSGCNHFNLINDYLKSKDVEPVDWNSP